MIIKPEPLRAEAFAPFGDVLEAPPAAGRNLFGDGLGNRRPGAAPSLAVACVPPLESLPLTATRTERHEFSSQSFLALDVARWLVIVAPKAGDGRPDTARARAFLAGPPKQGLDNIGGVRLHGVVVLGNLNCESTLCGLMTESRPLEESGNRPGALE